MKTTIEIDTVQMQCGECGVFFWVTPEFYRERRERKLGWHCPNGHGRVFGTSKVDELKEQLQAERESRENLEFELLAQKGALKAERARVTRLKKRVANGVCPCCHRSFVQLTRHMSTQHPKYGKEE
jgi:hypothetical protein